MAHFLYGERRIERCPDARNMGGPRDEEKAAQDEISVMFQPNRAPAGHSRKKATETGNLRQNPQKPWQEPPHGS
jgi:hypothetical protein